MADTKIEWADKVWQPVTGCTKISAGCANCYAARMANRLRGCYGYPADEPFKVTLHPERLEQPLHWRKPQRVFVCSMGDLFHEDVPDDFRDKVFAVMALCQLRGLHTFQVLTKRPERMAEYLNGIEERPEERETYDCPDFSLAPRIGQLAGDIEANKRNKLPMFGGRGCVLSDRCRLPIKNLWLGTSIEDQATADKRIPELLKCPAAVRFVSCEPLIAAINLTRHFYSMVWHGPPDKPQMGVSFVRDKLDWVIVGAETGPGARPMDPDWARLLGGQCQAAGVPFFMKAVSGKQPIPADLMIREFPKESPDD